MKKIILLILNSDWNTPVVNNTFSLDKFIDDSTLSY